MIVAIIFVYFTFFLTVNSERTPEEVAKKFDEFIDIVFDVPYSPPTDTHHQMRLVPYWDLTNLLRMTQNYVAAPVHEVQDDQPAIDEIYDVKIFF